MWNVLALLLEVGMLGAVSYTSGSVAITVVAVALAGAEVCAFVAFFGTGLHRREVI